MPLNPGTRLGAYEVSATIGAGGMGEVFRAKDTKLGRDVAIKVLPAAFAQDPERLARFEREARVLASLNHTNIAHIYGFESAALADGTTLHFLAMEMVEGEDLSARLRRGALPVDETIAIARQIAEGLEEAHEHGIVHRDLKPANIKLTPDGKVKILDFGLARAYESNGTSSAPDVSHSPTMSRHMTEAGMIMGTAAYMSPEQARGKTVDKRADIWAFGVVLFEMLTGERLFAGETVSDTLASVLKDAPRFAALPASTPPRLRRLVERCLERDIRVRLRDIGEARVEIAKIEAGAPESGAVSVPAGPSSHGPERRVIPLLLATAAVAIIATLGVARYFLSAAVTTGAIAHVSLALPDGHELGTVHLRPFAISADGTNLVYVGLHEGTNQLYLRSLSEPSPRVLEGTVGGASPFFSPDGKWIGFFADRKLKKIAVGGAALQTLADAPYQRGGSWGSDGYIYFAPANSGGIWRVRESGGPAEEVTKKDTPKGEISHRWPHFVAGTNTLLFGMWTGPGDDEQNVAVQTIGESKHHVLVTRGGSPRYAAATGMLLYTHMGTLFAVPWRPPQTDLGQAVPVAMPEQTFDAGLNESAGTFDVSRDGALAYLSGGRARNSSRLVWIDRNGKATLPPLPERNYETAVISPEGRRAIVQIREGLISLWMFDLARNTLTPIGTGAGSSQAPVWTPDGSRVIYRATRRGLRGIYWRLVDGSSEEEALTTKPDVLPSPSTISPDGRFLVFTETGAQVEDDNGLWVMQLDGDRTPRRLFPQADDEESPQLSPDGKWVAFEGPVSARKEIHVSPFPGPGPRHQISTSGGAEPLWSRDGRELFFQEGARLMVAAVTASGTFASEPPRLLYEGRFLGSVNSRTPWSITPDGSRFLRIQRVEAERAITRVDLVLNWFKELTAKAQGR